MWLFKKKAQDNVDPKSQVDRHCSFCAKDQAEVVKLDRRPKCLHLRRVRRSVQRHPSGGEY